LEISQERSARKHNKYPLFSLTGKKIISRQAGELDQLGWLKLPDSIIAALMVAGLTDKYSTLVSEIKNTALNQ
jgi:hypothetical protein